MVVPTPPDNLSEIPDGTPLVEIAARYDVTLAVAHRWVTAAGRRQRRYDEARILKLYAEGYTREEVAAEVGCAARTVSKYVRAAGLTRRPDVPRLDPAEVVRRYQAGQTLKEVPAALGCSGSGVWHVLDRAGVPRRPRQSRGCAGPSLT